MTSVPDGLGVRIPGFHPGGPGSIPGLGDFSCSTKFQVPLMIISKVKLARDSQSRDLFLCQKNSSFVIGRLVRSGLVD